MTSFGQRLRRSLRKHGPLSAGIDPHPGLLQAWGLGDDVDGLRAFTDVCVEAYAGQVASVKPQSAFFERFGSAGIAILEDAVRALRSEGTVVILDVKRGDIGTTAAAYAQAYLGEQAPLASDAITASPYLGFGSLTPMIERALLHEAGVFALALTSNPEGASVQHARSATGDTVAGAVLTGLREANREAADRGDWGSLGAVVGATIGQADEDLAIHGPLLVPGIGAQGGTLDDVRRIFGASVEYVVPTVSREILQHGPDATAIRAAAQKLATEFGELVG